MTPTQHSQREDGHKLINIPTPRDEPRFRHNHHRGNRQKAQRDGVLESLRDFWDLDEEVGELDFLGRGAPRHVDAEHVAEERLGNVKGHATEEDDEHKTPFEVLDHCMKMVSLVV